MTDAEQPVQIGWDIGSDDMTVVTFRQGDNIVATFQGEQAEVILAALTAARADERAKVIEQVITALQLRRRTVFFSSTKAALADAEDAVRVLAGGTNG